MTGAKRLLADVSLSPVRFRPGDRVIVRVRHSLDREQRRKLRRAVERWAGNCVEVLIVDQTRMEVEIERG